MQLCNNNHEQIVFDAPKCPLCVVLRQVVGLNIEVERLENENENLRNEVANATSKENPGRS